MALHSSSLSLLCMSWEFSRSSPKDSTQQYMLHTPATQLNDHSSILISGECACVCCLQEVMETFKSRISKLETLQRVTQVEMMANLRSRPQEFLFRFVSLLLTLATALLVFVFTVCSCPLPLIHSRVRTFTALMLLLLGAFAWQKWHTIATVDWEAWVPSKWRLDSKNSKPPLDGH